MRSTMAHLAAAAAAALAFSAAADAGGPLWDQSDFDEFAPGFFNVESGGPPFGLTSFTVNDISVTGPGWTVDSITTYYSALDPSWGDAITQGYLHLYSKTGPLPLDGIDDPTTSPLISMSATLMGSYFEVTASGLDLDLAPGDYWIGITPIAPSSLFGPEIHLSSMSLIGDDSASFDPFAFPGPPAWFSFNPGVDASLLIEGGTIPAPGAVVLLGAAGLAGFGRRRRG